MTVEEVVAEIKTYADSIEAHMDEGGEINRENVYDMCKHINILHQLYTINAKAFDDVGAYARGVYEPEDESKEKWQLDYGTLVPNLVKAIQEQQEQIEVLQNEIQQLKGEE